MRGLLRSLAVQGRAVLVSSHLMSEQEDAADHLVVIGRGKVIADTSAAELVAAFSGGRVTLRTSARPEAMTVLRRSGATVAATGRDTVTISGLAAGEIVALLGESAVPFAEVSAHRATLEQAYLELTRDARHRYTGLHGGPRDRARPAVPVPSPYRRDHRPALAAAPRTDRADERRAGHPGHHGLRSLSLSPWAGLSVLAAWAAAALLAGGLLLQLRNA